MPKARIVVVEDEPAIRRGVADALRLSGYEVTEAADGAVGLREAGCAGVDLVLLDIMLPKRDGLEVLSELRRTNPTRPVILLTARGSEDDRVRGLKMGADDYVVKPFGTRELLARIRALLRRTSPGDTKVLTFSNVEIDVTRRVVSKHGEELKLTRAEYNLLTYFLQNPDRALSRDMILNSVWGYESFPNTRTVDAHVVRLRQKLEPDAASPRHFLTVHGVGYRFLP